MPHSDYSADYKHQRNSPAMWGARSARSAAGDLPVRCTRERTPRPEEETSGGSMDGSRAVPPGARFAVSCATMASPTVPEEESR